MTEESIALGHVSIGRNKNTVSVVIGIAQAVGHLPIPPPHTVIRVVQQFRQRETVQSVTARIEHLLGTQLHLFRILEGIAFSPPEIEAFLCIHEVWKGNSEEDGNHHPKESLMVSVHHFTRFGSRNQVNQALTSSTDRCKISNSHRKARIIIKKTCAHSEIIIRNFRFLIKCSIFAFRTPKSKEDKKKCTLLWQETWGAAKPR